MSTFERPHVNRLVKHLTDDDGPMRIVAVTGPRQSGKTTLVQQALKRLRRLGRHARYIALDDPEREQRFTLSSASATMPIRRRHDPRWLVDAWLEARDDTDEIGGTSVLALDEIQYIEDWSATVKGLWDGDRRNDRPLRPVILGSAPWQLLTGMGESLAGRFTPFPVRHWSLAEMAEAFDVSLDEYAFFGGYPGAMPYRTDEREWRSYVAHAILAPAFERDILSLTRVNRPSLMRQLVDLGPEYSSQIVQYKHLAGRLRGGGSPTTLAHYLNLLSDAGLMTQLSKYSGSAIARTRSTPKLLVLNTALMTALSGYSFDEARSDRTFWGRIVETAVGAHLHGTIETGTHLTYWRDDPHEVDFVLSRGPRVLGIEVKSGRWRGSLPGLAAFKERFPQAETLLVGGRLGTRSNQVPLNEFLARPASHWLGRGA